MHILGIAAFYNDSAVCLLSDGKVVAAAQQKRRGSFCPSVLGSPGQSAQFTAASTSDSFVPSGLAM